MRQHKRRIERIEKQTAKQTTWQIRFVEYEPGGYEAAAAAVRDEAIAAGWQPGQSPYGIFIPKTRQLSDVPMPFDLMPEN